MIGFTLLISEDIFVAWRRKQRGTSLHGCILELAPWRISAMRGRWHMISFHVIHLILQQTFDCEYSLHATALGSKQRRSTIFPNSVLVPPESFMRQASIHYRSVPLRRPHKQYIQSPCTWVGTCFHRMHILRMRNQSRLAYMTLRRCRNLQTGQIRFRGYH